jgi:CRISPR-associated protein Cmr3
MSHKKQWRFDPLDSWFFREARAFDTSGSHELSSLFPPPARTVAGAIRTLIGEMQGVDWERFAQAGEYPDLKQQIGVDDDLGLLKMTGPYPLWKGQQLYQRLYPAPLHLLAKAKEYVFLKPGEPVACDLGKVRLPEKPKDSLPGAKPLETAWLDGADLQRVLGGESPKTVYHAKDLYDTEPRLGIARNPAQRTAADGLLYQTRHVRPRSGLAIGATVSGIAPELHPDRGVIRFGGEGRASAVTVNPIPPALAPPVITGHHLLLVLLTHADFGGGWLLPGFVPDIQHDVQVWRGQLHGVDLMLHSAALGKAAREGGWDLLHQQPRPVVSLIPAGSVYFCTVTGDPQSAVAALHGGHVGRNTALGRGELAVGLWKS